MLKFYLYYFVRALEPSKLGLTWFCAKKYAFPVFVQITFTFFHGGVTIGGSRGSRNPDPQSLEAPIGL